MNKSLGVLLLSLFLLFAMICAGTGASLFLLSQHVAWAPVLLAGIALGSVVLVVLFAQIRAH